LGAYIPVFSQKKHIVDTSVDNVLKLCSNTIIERQRTMETESFYLVFQSNWVSPTENETQTVNKT